MCSISGCILKPNDLCLPIAAGVHAATANHKGHSTGHCRNAGGLTRSSGAARFWFHTSTRSWPGSAVTGSALPARREMAAIVRYQGMGYAVAWPCSSCTACAAACAALACTQAARSASVLRLWRTHRTSSCHVGLVPPCRAGAGAHHTLSQEAQAMEMTMAGPACCHCAQQAFAPSCLHGCPGGSGGGSLWCRTGECKRDIGVHVAPLQVNWETHIGECQRLRQNPTQVAAAGLAAKAKPRQGCG